MAPPIVRTISRYLLRQHVAPLVFALAALTSLMLIQQVAKQLSGLLGKGLPPVVIAEVFVLSLPFIVAVTLPMAVLVAVLHVFTRLAGDNEMTALQAGGVSVARVVAPVLAGATGVALLSFLWNDQLLPRTNHELRTLQVDIARKRSEEHTSELQSRPHLVCRLLLEKKRKTSEERTSDIYPRPH